MFCNDVIKKASRFTYFHDMFKKQMKPKYARFVIIAKLRSKDVIFV